MLSYSIYDSKDHRGTMRHAFWFGPGSSALFGRIVLIRLLILLLLVSLGLHVWLAGLRRPIPPSFGYGINTVSLWSDSATKRMRVSTYNIHRGKGVDRIFDLSRTASVLQGADIIGMNEVAGPSLLGTSDQAEIIGRQLGMGWLYAPNQMRWFRHHFGNALLSRFQVNQWVSEPLIFDTEASHSLRNIIIAKIRFNDVEVAVLITHLDLGEIRSDQLSRVIQRFERYDPAILMGDFNSDLQDPRVAALIAQPGVVDAVAVALGEALAKRRVDWIFTRGFNVMGGGMTEVGVSDHPYFWVDLELDSIKTQ